MTRHTAPTRRTTGTLRLEAAGERDESDPHRHKWVTRLRFGLLSAEGPNTRGAVEYLEVELRALASCPEAIEALARARARLAVVREPPAAPPAKPPAPFADGEMVEVQLRLHDETWVAAEFLNTSHGGSLIAVWSERCGSLVVPKERVRTMNRPSLADVG